MVEVGELEQRLRFALAWRKGYLIAAPRSVVPIEVPCQQDIDVVSVSLFGEVDGVLYPLEAIVKVFGVYFRPP